MIRYIIAMILCAEGAFMLLPLAISIFGGEKEAAIAFVGSIALIFVAAVICGLKKPKNDMIFAKEGFIAVAAGWIVVSIFGALPFYFSGSIPSFIDCIFETVSGFTTTGATVLAEVEGLPKGILFWRAFTHWIGGMGILMFLLIITQLSEGHTLYIMRAEVPGPSVGKIAPRSDSNAMILYGIYTALTVIEAVLLLFSGMSVFDAVTNAMSTAGTGGFSVRNAGIGHYDSAYVEWVIGVFMVLFGINFNIYYLMILKRFKSALKSEELRVYLIIITCVTLFMAFDLIGYYGDFWTALRKSFFQTAAVITTTGFGGVEFMNWPMVCHSILLIVFFTGACAGSTGGGIKISRIIMSLKMLFAESRKLAHPRAVTNIKFEGKIVDKETKGFIMVYMTAFFVILAFASIFIMAMGHDYETAFSAALSCLNNVGPALGEVGHGGVYTMFNQPTKVFMAMLMLIGRLEIFPIIILFMPSTWKKH